MRVSSVPQHWIIFHHPKWSHDFKDSITTHFINPRYVFDIFVDHCTKETYHNSNALRFKSSCNLPVCVCQRRIAHKIKGEIASLCAIDNTNNVYIMYCAMKTTHSTSTKIYLQSTYHKHHWYVLPRIIFLPSNNQPFYNSFATRIDESDNDHQVWSYLEGI